MIFFGISLYLLGSESFVLLLEMVQFSLKLHGVSLQQFVSHA
jgi:hypothetical protein